MLERKSPREFFYVCSSIASCCRRRKWNNKSETEKEREKKMYINSGEWLDDTQTWGVYKTPQANGLMSN